jgi:hypothetical protein
MAEYHYSGHPIPTYIPDIFRRLRQRMVAVKLAQEQNPAHLQRASKNLLWRRYDYYGINANIV